MINPFNNEHYGIAADSETVKLLTADATTKMSKAEARLLARALLAVADGDELEAVLISQEAERASDNVGKITNIDDK